MILLFTIILLCLGIVGLVLIDEKKMLFLKQWSLLVTSFVWVLASLLIINFDCNYTFFQYVLFYNLNYLNHQLVFSFGLDGLSIIFFF